MDILSMSGSKPKKKKSFLQTLFGCAFSLGQEKTVVSLTADAQPGEDAAGWMHKLGGKGKAKFWQKRLFVLKGTELYYYKNRADPEPKGVIRLTGASFYFVKSSTDKENHFRIKHSDFKVRDLAAEDQVWLDAWTELIEKAIEKADKNKEMAGWLFKKDKRGKQGWKRRYCVISADGVLRYYENPDDLTCKGHLDLKGGGVELVGADKIGKRQSSLRESMQGGRFTFNVLLEDQTRQFYSESFTDRQKWIASIERNSKRGEENSDHDSDEGGAKGRGACVVSGWALKKGGGNSTFGRRDWKKRFLVLTKDGTLYWFKKELHAHKMGSLQANHHGYPSKYNHAFKIDTPNRSKGFEARAETNAEMRLFCKEIQEIAGEHKGGSTEAEANMV
ncbi:hypothetical protein TrRE_jg4177 [Triparma retinervis]|uniref:PH domain-containing protein n=1 Tax=Triparma retinervis TaxID=2557542 RepID=A0A9W6ZP12_9STRA|nr:hypothetical protein TrRE_jg4177 [Triparma retinervis]